MNSDLVCSACGAMPDSNWRFDGRFWEHHCKNSGQAGHFPAITKAQYLKDKNLEQNKLKFIIES